MSKTLKQLVENSPLIESYCEGEKGGDYQWYIELVDGYMFAESSTGCVGGTVAYIISCCTNGNIVPRVEQTNRKQLVQINGEWVLV